MSTVLSGPPLAPLDDAEVDAALSVFAAADEAPGAPALLVDGCTLEFAALADAARQVSPARALTPRGDRATAAAIYAALAAREPLVLLHPRLPEAERAALAARVPPSLPADTAAVIFTSGSSGRPKGVVLSRRAFATSAIAGARLVPWADPAIGDRWLCCLPLAHVGGLAILVRCLVARRTAVLVDGFDAAAVAAALERHEVTICSLVPTMLARLLDDPAWRPPPSVRAVILGGAAAPAPLLAAAASRGVPLLPSYGMTETCAQICTGDRVLGGTEIRLDSAGRLQVRGPTMLTGYLDEPSPVDEGGWFTTGDRGVIDGGRLIVTGRADDVIVTGGENVDPLAVEAAVLAVDGVRAACAFAVPDPEWGQLVALAVVASDDAIATLPAELGPRLPPFCRPRLVAALDALPLGATGKIDRRAAAALARPRLRRLRYPRPC